jgi:hypothetical protein
VQSLIAADVVDQRASVDQAAANMEGKEVRFGVVNSALWATATDRRLQWLGQRDARLVHAARRGWCPSG